MCECVYKQTYTHIQVQNYHKMQQQYLAVTTYYYNGTNAIKKS